MDKCCICLKKLKDDDIKCYIETDNFGLYYNDIICVNCNFEIEDLIKAFKKQKQEKK